MSVSQKPEVGTFAQSAAAGPKRVTHKRTGEAVCRLSPHRLQIAVSPRRAEHLRMPERQTARRQTFSAQRLSLRSCRFADLFVLAPSLATGSVAGNAWLVNC